MSKLQFKKAATKTASERKLLRAATSNARLSKALLDVYFKATRERRKAEAVSKGKGYNP